MRSVASESAMVQSIGHVSVVNMREYELYSHYNRKFSKEVAALHAALPAKVVTVHAVMRARHEALRKLVLPVLKWIFGKRLRQRLITHSGHDRQIVQEFEDFGIHAHSMTSLLGGALGPGYFQHWLVERRALETRRTSVGP